MLTAEQLLMRKTGIGGSDGAAICGLSKYATPLDIYLDKTTNVVKETTDAMRRGTILEPFVRSLYERETGYTVQEICKTERHKEHTFMLANLDGVLPSERALVEFKTASYMTKKNWGEAGSDEIPQEYLIQVAHYASVMDIDTVHIGVLFGDEALFKAFMALQHINEQFIRYPIDFDALEYDFRIYTYQRNRELERKLINKERGFWFDHVEKRVPPSPQAGNVEDLLKAYPKADDQTIEVDQEALNKIQELASIKQKKKEIEEQESKVKASVMSLFGNASSLVDSSTNKLLATWKNKTRSLFDKQSFSDSHPDLCQAFMIEKTSRELRLI